MESCKFDIIRKTSVIPIYFIPQKLMKIRFHRGFTLIELLLIVGIIAILASIVIVAINPTKQLGSARDAERRVDLDEILTAVYQYAVDHDGEFPPELLSDEQEICVYDMFCDGVALKSLQEKYLPTISRDPLAARD